MDDASNGKGERLKLEQRSAFLRTLVADWVPIILILAGTLAGLALVLVSWFPWFRGTPATILFWVSGGLAIVVILISITVVVYARKVQRQLDEYSKAESSRKAVVVKESTN